MRVISGTAKGRRLQAPKGLKTRPTADRVKEAVFNIISPFIGQARFLDLFAGSGGMGIEALSRGAKSVTFIEQDLAALKVLKANLDATGLGSQATVIKGDVFSVLTNLEGEQFDLVYIDPPYNLKLGERILIKLKTHKLASVNSLIMLEAMSKEEIMVDNLEKISARRYGDTAVFFFKNS